MSSTTLTPTKAKELLDNQEAVLIDVRDADEYAVRYIPGAHLQPLATLGQEPLPNGTTKIIVHCQTGIRAEQARKQLSVQMPQAEVYNLKGGIVAWGKAGLPTGGNTKAALPIMRQVQMIAGSLTLTFALLGYFVNPLFIFGAAFIGAGLTMAGATGWCGMGLLLAKMPWNR